MSKWQTSTLVCDACAKRWVGVHPTTAEYAECPRCGHMEPTPYIEEGGGEGQATETPRSSAEASSLRRMVQVLRGLWLGWRWTHCNGETTKTTAVIASCHPRESITWLWSLYYTPRATGMRTHWNGGRYGSAGITLPLLGNLTLNWQPSMWRTGEHQNGPDSPDGAPRRLAE